MRHSIYIACLAIFIACNSGKKEIKTSSGPFASDQAFLQEHTDALTLTKGDAAVIVVPAYQGRVMTSTYHQQTGPSFGWINRPVIEKGFLSDDEKAGKLEEHIYIFGGEERFWLGPEGGQYGLFFEPGTSFEFDDWKTPAAIDTEAFELVERTEESAIFQHKCTIMNYKGTTFEMGIKRTVRLLGKDDIESMVDGEIGEDIRFVGYETDNRLTNLGENEWIPEDGLPSIWLLGMYNPSPNTTIVIPFIPGPESEFGAKVNDTYFGKVPAEYLNVEEEVLFFKGDGAYRSKIGISPKRSLGVAGSYDADGQVLTLVTYNVQEAPNGFVNSMWEIQEEPYNGDVINSYNDGSPAPGQPPLGPFYEIETSSPAAALAPGESIQHIQKTIHLYGPEEQLDSIARRMLGVSIVTIKKGI